MPVDLKSRWSWYGHGASNQDSKEPTTGITTTHVDKTIAHHFLFRLRYFTRKETGLHLMLKKTQKIVLHNKRLTISIVNAWLVASRKATLILSRRMLRPAGGTCVNGIKPRTGDFGTYALSNHAFEGIRDHDGAVSLSMRVDFLGVSSWHWRNYWVQCWRATVTELWKI